MLVHRYILRELAKPTLSALFGFLALIFVLQLLRFGPDAVRLGVSVQELLWFTLLFLPPLSVLIIPLALTVGSFVAFSRLAADGELQVLDGFGVGPLRLMLVPIAVALLGAGLSFYAGAYLGPRSVVLLERLAVRVALRTMTSGLKPRIFNQFDKNLTIYFAARESGGLRNVMLYDGRDKRMALLVTSQRASIRPTKIRGRVQLRLERGELHRLERDRASYQRMGFGELIYVLDLRALLRGRFKVERDTQQLTPEELRRAIARRKAARQPTIRLELELTKRFSLPPGVLLFVALTILLSYRISGRGREWVVPLIAVVVFAYYLLLRAGDALAGSGHVSALVAGWLPNAVYLGAIALLWYRRRKPAG
ncbi:MAG: LptF/LptG family permease [Myxococcales bacterium]|nr:LptF/LptG family permease [Myxococcales bacterium]